MSQQSKSEILAKVKYHYERSNSKCEKSRLLSALCIGCGWERKYAIKCLRAQRGPQRTKPPSGQRRHGGPRPKYDRAVVGQLKHLWLASGQICGKRLVPVLGMWLDSWEKRHGAVAPAVRRKLLEISPAQADRLLRPFKVKGRRRPHAANEVRRQVPLRTGPWQVEQPGWIEGDTVAHCGGSLRGSHGWSVVLTDIYSGWTEARMSWNRNDLAVFKCICQIEQALPFAIIGFDSDNGGEFLNGTLLRYWKERQPAVEVSRSRAYRKNDNAHVEQKNLVMVREHLGYGRIDTPASVEAFSQALALLSLRANLYQASAKLLGKKTQAAGRPTKQYEKRCRTPWQRLMEHPAITESQKRRLEGLRRENDPLELNERIEKKLREGYAALEPRGEEASA